MTQMKQRVTDLLESVFGFDCFRPNQEGIVSAILERRDVFAVMPTGGGKSLCYQLPAILCEGTALVVSPLISLMKDQVDAAKELGIRAAFLNSTLSTSQKEDVADALCAGQLDLLYVSPERFAMDGFVEVCRGATISFVAVDEAHCLSEWGHDFRPDYLSLSGIKERLPGARVAAFTATATSRVQADIIARLKLANPHVVRASFDRPNLQYRIFPRTNGMEQIYDIVKQNRDASGIVYRLSRKDVESTAGFLKSMGVNALPYHAGLPNDERKRNQEAFSRDKVDVVVATIAFGMGIDKSNVRYIIHGDLPQSIEGYYQETGRAGRDGEPATCTLLFASGDVTRRLYFINNIENEKERENARQKLFAMSELARGQSCRRRTLLRYFQEAYAEDRCDNCDVCLDLRNSEASAARGEVPYDEGLFHELRELRMSLSRKKEIPPFVIFSDRSLREMAAYMPTTEQEMGRIHGVGRRKLQQYGEVFAKEIRLYKDSFDVTPAAPPQPMGSQVRRRSGVDPDGRPTPTVWATYELVKRGMGTEEIARKRKLAVSTVSCHLEALAATGLLGNLERYVDKQKQALIQQAYRNAESGRLRDVKDALPEEISFEEIRIVLATLDEKAESVLTA